MTEQENQLKHIGYKKCKDGRIVVLEILDEHNENRNNIFDKRYAKYRCSMALVLDIYDMNDKTLKYDSATSIHDKTFIYKVGEIVVPKNEFESNLNEICSPGIHYFLTEEPAKFWNCEISDGPHKTWYDNGHLMRECRFKNSKYDGLFISYCDNGQVWKECIYDEGRVVYQASILL